MARESAWDRARRQGVRGAFLGIGKGVRGVGEGFKTMWTGTEGVEDQYRRALATGFGPAGADAAGIAPPRFMGQPQQAAGQAATPGYTSKGIGIGPQQALDAASLRRATESALPFYGEAMQTARGEMPTATESPSFLRGVSRVGSRQFVPGTSAEEVSEALANRIRTPEAVTSGQIGPNAPSFLDRTRRNAALYGIRRADYTGNEQLIADRALQIREARTLEDKQRLREQFRKEDIAQRTGIEQRAAGIAEAQAMAEGAIGKAAIPAQIAAIAREGVAQGASVTDMLNQWMENGVPILDKNGNPEPDFQGRPQTRPPNQQEIQEAQQMFNKMVGVQTGGAPGLANGGDLNNDGIVSKEEGLYNQISATLKTNPNIPAADRKRLTDERKRLEGILFPHA